MLGYFSAKTRDGKSAISENHSKFIPIGSHATEAASMPEHTLPTDLRIIGKSPYV